MVEAATRQEPDKVKLTEVLAKSTARLDSLVRDLLKRREEEKQHLAIQWGPEVKYIPERDDRLRDIKSAIEETEDKIALEMDMLEGFWRAYRNC